MKKSPVPIRLLCAILSLLVAVSPCAVAQIPKEPAKTEDSASELLRLRTENQKLREENQRLRQLLTTTPATPAPAKESGATHKPANAPETAKPADAQGLTHWITTSSGKRHNSACRYFKTTQGRMGRADEGVACRVCGG